jgi:hypothetical protein
MLGSEPKTAGFFLELERAHKSRQVLQSKLERYAEFYYGGSYLTRFGTPALRLLVVFAPNESDDGARRAWAALPLARQLGIGFVRVATLNQIKSACTRACLAEPMWLAPNRPEAVALFNQSADGRAEANGA